jgi:hypothetical protein
LVSSKSLSSLRSTVNAPFFSSSYSSMVPPSLMVHGSQLSLF